MTTWLLLAGAIASEVTASLSLKGALDQPALYVIVVTGFVAAFTFLFAALGQGMALGVAYGIWAACGVALTAVLSSVIYDEPLTPLMGLGIAVIIGGVLLVELGSQAAHAATASAEDEAL
ncbi:DMT family transporter [Aeromicrobium alkaliterrae]|uniref:SMR family transporter n=1 Tax=Aeromicrobium alkaliterrae TaxID=302168 RepID=A0ABN2JR36_9ACTN